MADKRDYYEVLGVEKSASQSDLKNSFRRLARKYHPDRSTEEDAENRFKEIQEAYAVLSDEQKRAHYDRFGHDGPQGSPFGGFGSGGFNINFEDILGSDFFSNIFGGGSARRRTRRGSDILLRHSVNLEDVLHGTEQRSSSICLSPVTPAKARGQKTAIFQRAILVLDRANSGYDNRLVRSFKNPFNPVTTVQVVERFPRRFALNATGVARR